MAVHGIDGRARIVGGRALETMDYLARFYIGRAPDTRCDVSEGLNVRVAIDRIYGQGPWHQTKPRREARRRTPSAHGPTEQNRFDSRTLRPLMSLHRYGQVLLLLSQPGMTVPGA